jgi:hypothetical protein
MMIHKSPKLNPYQKNGLPTLAHIVDSEIKIASSSAPTKLVANGFVTKEYSISLYQGEAGFASHIIFHLVKSKHN